MPRKTKVMAKTSQTNIDDDIDQLSIASSSSSDSWFFPAQTSLKKISSSDDSSVSSSVASDAVSSFVQVPPMKSSNIQTSSTVIVPTAEFESIASERTSSFVPVPRIKSISSSSFGDIIQDLTSQSVEPSVEPSEEARVGNDFDNNCTKGKNLLNNHNDNNGTNEEDDDDTWVTTTSKMGIVSTSTTTAYEILINQPHQHDQTFHACGKLKTKKREDKRSETSIRNELSLDELVSIYQMQGMDHRHHEMIENNLTSRDESSIEIINASDLLSLGEDFSIFSKDIAGFSNWEQLSEISSVISMENTLKYVIEENHAREKTGPAIRDYFASRQRNRACRRKNWKIRSSRQKQRQHQEHQQQQQQQQQVKFVLVTTPLVKSQLVKSYKDALMSSSEANTSSQDANQSIKYRTLPKIDEDEPTTVPILNDVKFYCSHNRFPQVDLIFLKKGGKVVHGAYFPIPIQRE